MNVISLFDGLSGGRIALDNLGINVTNYFACEIDEYAIKVSNKNFPDIIQLGDVKKVTKKDIPVEIDLMIGGSPCQDLSKAKSQRKGLEGTKSQLFFEYVRLKNELQPKYFIFENVASMKQKDKDLISQILGVDPILINSNLVTAQNRKRLYWTNFSVDQPKDRNIFLKDIIETGFTDRDKSHCIKSQYHKGTNLRYYQEKHANQLIFMKKDNKLCDFCITGEKLENIKYQKGKKSIKRIKNGHKYTFQEGAIKFPQELTDKSQTLMTSVSGRCGTYIKQRCTSCTRIRKLTPIECERLQGIPDNYTNQGISNTQRYKMIGNGFTIPVIEHLIESFI